MVVPKWLIQTLKDSGVTDFTNWNDSRLRTRSQNHSISLSTSVLLQTNYSLLSATVVAKEPITIEEALSQPMWKAATMEAEIGSIEQDATWELVPRPPRRKIIGVRWVYKTKYRSDGTLDKHKA